MPATYIVLMKCIHAHMILIVLWENRVDSYFFYKMKMQPKIREVMC